MNTSYLNILKVILKVHTPLWLIGMIVLKFPVLLSCKKWDSGKAWIVLPHKNKVAMLFSKHYAIKK